MKDIVSGCRGLFRVDGNEGPAGPTIVTGAHGVFSFSTADYDFAPGSTCLVTASAEGFFPNSSETFEVTPGENDIGDLFLDQVPS